ncbi:MAG: DUF167 family protein [Devosia sp.]
MSPNGLTLFLRVTPNAGRDEIEGVETRDDGSAVLRIRVKAVPDKGKANAAVVVLLAKVLGVSKSAIELVSGDTARAKTVVISGDAAQLAATVSALIAHD